MRQTIEALRQSMGDEHATARVTEFLDMAGERIAEATTHATQLSSSDLGHLLHPIRTASVELCADELAWICGRMATMAESGDMQSALALLPILNSRYKDARAAMLAALDKSH